MDQAVTVYFEYKKSCGRTEHDGSAEAMNNIRIYEEKTAGSVGR